MVLPSSASNGTRLCDFPFSADSWCCRNDGLRFLTQQADCLCSANHGSIRDFSPIAFSGCPRGHKVSSRDFVLNARSLTGSWILTLEPERLENQRPSPREIQGRTLHRRSSCLLFQIFGVETD